MMRHEFHAPRRYGPLKRASPVILCLALLLGGCAGDRIIEDAQPAPPYPEAAAYGPDLDIIAVREGETIRLVNRTARAYDNLVLWLNRRYVRPIGHIAIGTDNTWPLESFINRYREPYPVGSFLRPDDSRRLVLAELYDHENDLRYRLVVQPPGTR